MISKPKIVTLCGLVVGITAGLVFWNGRLLIAAGLTAVWILVLWDLLGRRDIDIHDKLSWVVVVLLLNWIGGLTYLFFGPVTEKKPNEMSDSVTNDFKCMACGARIPAGSDACPSCEWTYKENQ